MTYPDVWPGVDVVYTVLGDRVKEDIVVSDSRRAEFPFAVHGLGLTPADREARGRGVALMATGWQADEVSVLDAEVLDAEGRIADAKANPELRVEPATASRLGDAAGEIGDDAQVLTVAVDEDWLADEELPIVVDPTVVLDQSFRSSYKSDGTVLDGVRIGNPLDGGNYWRSGVAFGYWTALQGKQVLHASLGLGVADGSSTSTYNMSAWWACSGSYSGSICNGDTSRQYATGQLGGPGTGTTLDITHLIGTWHFLGVQTGIIGLRGSEQSGVFTYKRLHPPVLTLNLNTPLSQAPGLVAPANKSLAITSTTPLLKWNPVTDPDGDTVKYTVKIATGTDGESGLVASSSLGTATSWRVPEGVLRDGQTYYWKVFATDGHSWKASGVRSLTVDRRLGEGAMSPTDEFADVITNLVTGNVGFNLTLPEMTSVGGGIGVDLAYNSQTPAGGLLGEYRHDVDRDSLTAGIEASDPVVLSRTDAQVSFDWRSEAQGGQPGSSPAPSPGVPEDHFTVRWRGYVALPAGQWQLGQRVDNGVRIWVDDTQVIDDWANGAMQDAPEFQSGTIAGGGVYKLRIDFREATGAAGVELWARTLPTPTRRSSCQRPGSRPSRGCCHPVGRYKPPT